MNNTPMDLNAVLFAQLDRLSNPSLKGGELEAEIQKAEAIEKISEQVIKNNNMRRVIWEKEYGPVPMNKVLAFKNQDKTDCRLENLILMSRTDMVRYNQSYQKLANPENNESCLLMAKVKNIKHQLLEEVS